MEVYHSFITEFRGETLEDIIQALHRDSAQFTGENLDQWWQRQQTLWSMRYEIHIPDRLTPDSTEKMIEALLAVGVVEPGPSPVPVPVITKDSSLPFRPLPPPADGRERRLFKILRRSLFSRFGMK